MACYNFQKSEDNHFEKKTLIYQQQEVCISALLLSPFVLLYRYKETKIFYDFSHWKTVA